MLKYENYTPKMIFLKSNPASFGNIEEAYFYEPRLQFRARPVYARH